MISRRETYPWLTVGLASYVFYNRISVPPVQVDTQSRTCNPECRLQEAVLMRCQCVEPRGSPSIPRVIVLRRMRQFVALHSLIPRLEVTSRQSLYFRYEGM